MRQPRVTNDTTDLPIKVASSGDGGRITALVSAIALIFSAYSLWETSLKQPDLKLFVPEVIQYTAPYQNSNFEAFQIPVTLANDGTRTGTILALELAVTDLKSGQTKRFFGQDLGSWSMERARSRAFQPFAPISLAGRSSRSDTVLFYTKGEAEKPAQLVSEPGSYRFKLSARKVPVDDFGWLDRLLPQSPIEASFDMELKFYDARAFNNGTLPLYSVGWRGGGPTP